MPELVELERLDNIIRGALAEGLHRRVHCGEGRDQDDRRPRLECARLAKQVHAAQSRHDDVADDEVEALIRHDRQGLFTAPGRADFVAVGAQTPGERVLDRALVVDNQDRGAHTNSSDTEGSRSVGRTTVTVEPTPG